MFFYYSGTGNSYAAASALGDCCALTNIMACMDKGEFSFSLEEGESVGFACPVCNGGIPKLAADFFRQIRFDRQPAYLYLVLTYSDHWGNAAVHFASLLSEAGLELDAFYAVPMPENNVIEHVILPEEERDAVYERAEELLKEIARRIDAKEKIPAFCEPGYKDAEEKYSAYLDMCHTSHFHVDDQCVSCGICATRCPYHSIRLIDGVPTWIKDACTLCMGCMRCGAIHYDEATIGKKRYTHPLLKKGGHNHAGHSQVGGHAHS